MVRRFALGTLFVIGLAALGLVGVVLFSGPSDRTSARDLLGVPLPASVTDEQVSVQHQSFGEYVAYVRFELDQADVPALLSDPAFQQAEQGTRPMAVFWNGSLANRSVTEIVQERRPAWWQPEAGAEFTLVYRSFPGPGVPYSGPDSAWYIVETSDPAWAIVHVFALEV